MLKNIIFDLGGVILNIDFQLAAESFRKLGLTHFEDIYSKISQTTLFDDFEAGKISPSEFRNALRKYLPFHVTDEQIDKAWDAMLLDIPPERIELLRRLKKDHKLFLLSNTNAIHEKAYTTNIIRQYGSNVMFEVFDKIYMSHHLGKRKPDKEIFQLVMKENNLDPKETLFIDDSPVHVEGAQAAGLDAILLEKDKTILDLFKE